MSNSPKKRNVTSGSSSARRPAGDAKAGAAKTGAKTTGAKTSGAAKAGAKAAGAKTTGAKAASTKGSGPKVSGSKSAKDRNRAMTDARKAASGGNNQLTLWIVAGVLVLALVIAGIIAVNNSNSEKEKAQASVDLGAGTLDNGAITWGEQSAPVTIEYYVDLLCPACRVYETQAAPTVEDAVKAGDAKLVVHPVAILDGQTDPAGYSSRSASALLCAADKPNGYLYMKDLYEQQPPEGGAGLSDQQLRTIGEEAGLGDDWTKCLDDGVHAETPKTNTEAFAAKGYPGTPTILVNGNELKSGTVDELEQAIESNK